MNSGDAGFKLYFSTGLYVFLFLIGTIVNTIYYSNFSAPEASLLGMFILIFVLSCAS